MPSSQHIHDLIEHLFRHEWSKIVASLTRILGMRHLDLCEEVAQEAMVKALRVWPFQGIPDNQTAWLIRVARNRALDVLKRQANLRSKEREVQEWAERALADSASPAPSDDELDEQLWLMFACCDPRLPHESSVALTLKTLCGFSVTEIARAFLSSDATIAQRIVRAKRKIADEGIELSVPNAASLPHRLHVVLEVIYLLFNEGYAAHQGDMLVRQDVMDEALRLGGMLARHAGTNRPEVHALMAMMLFQRARGATRVGNTGHLLLLDQQDRSRWDQTMIGEGLDHIQRAMVGDEVTHWHCEAGIAACHARATDFEGTDWKQVLGFYDLLAERKPTPVVLLNRAVALAFAEGWERGLQAIEPLKKDSSLKRYYLLPAAEGEILRRAGRVDEAAEAFARALELDCSEPERAHLGRKLEGLESAP